MYTLAKIVSVVHAGRDRLFQLVERCRETTTFILRPERKDSRLLKADRERWKRMGESGHLYDWLDYHPGLSIRRRLAMRLAYTNRPEGKGCALAYNQLMRAGGFDTNDKTPRCGRPWSCAEAQRSIPIGRSRGCGDHIIHPRCWAASNNRIAMGLWGSIVIGARTMLITNIEIGTINGEVWRLPLMW
jgi:hypothetical protein